MALQHCCSTQMRVCVFARVRACRDRKTAVWGSACISQTVSSLTRLHSCKVMGSGR